VSRSKSAARSLYLSLLPPVVLLATLGTTCVRALSEDNLVGALCIGGCVSLARHASSPRAPPEAAQADAANVQFQRQLDDGVQSMQDDPAGMQAGAMGALPIGRIRTGEWPQLAALATSVRAAIATVYISSPYRTCFSKFNRYGQTRRTEGGNLAHDAGRIERLLELADRSPRLVG
jgi:hypothetical protein